MAHFVKLTSLAVKGLEAYRTLRQPMDHFKHGFFIAEGSKVVERLLESDHQIISLLLSPEWYEVLREKVDRHQSEPTIYLAEKSLLEEIVGYNLHQGVMALGKIPEALHLETFLHSSPRPYFLAAVEGLANSENLGVLVRNCAGFGVQGLLVGETSSSPYLRRSVRNSLGAIFKLPIVHLDNLERTLVLLKDRFSVQTIAAHPQGSDYTVQTMAFDRDCCIVFGSEAEGISERILNVCTSIVSIPMAREIDSINVASASAVFLYEIQKQRQSF